MHSCCSSWALEITEVGCLVLIPSLCPSRPIFYSTLTLTIVQLWQANRRYSASRWLSQVRSYGAVFLNRGPVAPMGPQGLRRGATNKAWVEFPSSLLHSSQLPRPIFVNLGFPIFWPSKLNPEIVSIFAVTSSCCVQDWTKYKLGPRQKRPRASFTLTVTLFAILDIYSEFMLNICKKLTSLKLSVRTMWWCQSTKTAKIFG